LFSHAELVQELLEAFAPPGVSELLDYTTLRLENGNYVTPAMKPRADDVVWSVELQGRRIYLYLLLEFQSTPDDAMPARMLQYVAALYDHLLRSKAVDITDGLPPVLPIVLYNGDARWRQSSELYNLIRVHPQVLKAFQPRLKFWLLDQGAFAAAELEDMHRVVAAIFCFEHTPNTAAAKRAIRNLADAVAQSPFKQRIDRVVTRWIKHRLQSKMPGLAVPDAEELTKGMEMLETNIDRWEAQAIAKGMQQGVLQGMQQGMQKGMQQGIQQGMQQGEALLLQRLLTRRFGALSATHLARIAAATPTQLETWGDRVLDATSLDEVFGDTRH
jgi:predicted transposase/invertase (TIGR01784 family)